MKIISGFLKLILGFSLAIAVLLGSGVTIALYFINRTAVQPEKPIFANDRPKGITQKPKATPVKNTSTSKSKPTPKPTPKKTAKPLPPGAYEARVTWPQGLSIRDQPSLNGKSVGGVAVNRKLIILGTSNDKRWQKIRVADTNQEGWVKAGNTRRLE